MKKIITTFALLTLSLSCTPVDWVIKTEKITEAKPVVSPINYETVKIPAGEFIMGTETVDSVPVLPECPEHKVYLDEYYIGKYELTNSLYKKYVDDGGPTPYFWDHKTDLSTDFKSPDLPVVGVGWYDAVKFANWLSNKEGLELCYKESEEKDNKGNKIWKCDFSKNGYRLPTEAEWEKAARGTDGRFYPWGNEKPDDIYKEERNQISAVGSYSKDLSPYGVMDMAGNVWEWCNDWYDPLYYQNSPYKNPVGPDIKEDGYYGILKSVRSAYAVFAYCWDRSPTMTPLPYHIGFRLCRSRK